MANNSISQKKNVKKYSVKLVIKESFFFSQIHNEIMALSATGHCGANKIKRAAKRIE